jgi:hypothetical protein
MRRNILYAGLFALTVVVVFIMASGSKEAPAPGAGNLPAALKEGGIEHNPAAFTQQAVTVIKPSQKEGPDISKEDIFMPGGSQGLYQASTRSLSGSDEIKDEKALAAGVTRMGKYPTKEEIKEMNSRGIVLY